MAMGKREGGHLDLDPFYRMLEQAPGGSVPPTPPKPPLNPPGSGGTFGGMEARLAALETHMEHVRGDLGKLADVPADMATLKADVGHLPSKAYIDLRLLSLLAVIAALIAFSDKIKALVG